MINLKKRFEIGLATTQIDPLLEYKQYIESFFIGLPIFNNCRSNYILLDKVGGLIEKAGDIPVWVTLNSPLVEKHNLDLIVNTSIGAYKTFKFKGFIVTNIELMLRLKDYGIPVIVSTVNDIRDLNDINRYVKMGFKDIVLSYKVNRNLSLINEAVDQFPNVRFRLITNEICEIDCPFRDGHFITTSLNQEPPYLCGARQPNNSKQWRLNLLQSSFIPPDNLRYYPESVIFKLSTRTINYPVDKIAFLLKLYTGQMKYYNILPFFDHHIRLDGLLPLKVSKMIMSKWVNCKNQCYKCKICESELDRLIKEEK